MNKSDILNEKSVVAVIVTYNRKKLLIEAINALLGINYSNLSILIVDNNSTDGTDLEVEGLLNNSKIIYKKLKENLGGAGGFNYGIKEAVLLGCDYIWIMDDDCIVNDDSLNELLLYANKVNDNFGYLSSQVKWVDGSPCVMNIQRMGLSKEIKNFTKDSKIMLASFVSLFLRRETVEEIGLPIKDFFIWGDDWEYTYRISKKLPCYYVCKSIVTHKCAKNIGVNIVSDNNRLDRYFYGYRNEKFFYSKVGIKGKVYNSLKLIYHKFKIKFTKNEHKLEKLAIIKKAIKSAKSFNPKIEYVFSDKYNLNVACFFAEPLAYGGQEAFMLNMYKEFKNKHIIYKIATPFTLTNKGLIALANKRNEKIIAYNYKFDSIFRKKYIKKAIKRFLKNNNVDVIHIQSGSIYALLNIAKIAKKYNVKKIIVHSHCAGNNKNLMYRLIKAKSDKHIDKYVDYYFACSHLAAKWKFPNDIINNKLYTIIKNGIDLDSFKFSIDIRRKYRNEFNIDDYFVLCNVGRFSIQKNHDFILKLNQKLKNEGFKFKCILVGSGELKEQILNKIKELDMQDYYIILENRSDVCNIMMASDCFILPSLYEGLAVTSIESQATGLPTLCSSSITSETNISDLISFISIDSVNEWVEKIVSIKNEKYDRFKYEEIVKKAGYDAKSSAEYLENIYKGII